MFALKLVLIQHTTSFLVSWFNIHLPKLCILFVHFGCVVILGFICATFVWIWVAFMWLDIKCSIAAAENNFVCNLITLISMDSCAVTTLTTRWQVSSTHAPSAVYVWRYILLVIQVQQTLLAMHQLVTVSYNENGLKELWSCRWVDITSFFILCDWDPQRSRCIRVLFNLSTCTTTRPGKAVESQS